MPASELGLWSGDVIVSIDGKKRRPRSTIYRFLTRDVLAVAVSRGDEVVSHKLVR